MVKAGKRYTSVELVEFWRSYRVVVSSLEFRRVEQPPGLGISSRSSECSLQQMLFSTQIKSAINEFARSCSDLSWPILAMATTTTPRPTVSCLLHILCDSFQTHIVNV